ncbi:MAG: four helix bundle protein [Ferruginibacter sp.]
MSINENVIITKSFAFAVRIVRLYKLLSEHSKEFVISKQLLRCGTSVGANVREAHNAESKNDFIHKMGIAQKEVAETLYWLELLKATNYLNQKEFGSIEKDATELLKIIRSIIITTKKGKREI